jgi:hypothetical protein
MNKNIIIVSTYPNTKTKENVLSKTLDCIKIDDFDILLVSNYKIFNKEILDKCDYYIYDSLDVQNFVQYGIYDTNVGNWFENDVFRIEIGYDNAYHFDILRSIYLGLNLANSLGYNFFYYVEGDCFLTKENLDNLMKVKEHFLFKNKKFLVFKGLVDDKSCDDCHFYCTIIFGGMVSFYLDNLTLPYNVQDWINDDFYMKNNLESIMYKLLKPYDNDIYKLNMEYVLPDFKENLNKNNKNVELGFRKLFYFNGDDIYMYITNKYHKPINVYMKINDISFIEKNISPSNYFIKKITIDDILNKNIDYEIYMNDELEYKDIFIINDDNINILKKINRINFK